MKASISNEIVMYCIIYADKDGVANKEEGDVPQKKHRKHKKHKKHKSKKKKRKEEKGSGSESAADSDGDKAKTGK